MRKFPHKLSACALAAAALLSACGGGGDASAPTDTVAPTVAITDGTSDATTASPVTFTFAFSEAVKEFTDADVTVTGGAKGTLNMASDGRSATLVVTPAANSAGTMVVNVAVGAFSDAAGNTNTAIASGSQVYDTVVVVPASTTIATFDETSPATLLAFEGTSTAYITDNGSKVAQLTKTTAAEPWGGATFHTCPAGTDGESPAIPFTTALKSLSVMVKAPRAGVIYTLKAEGTGTNAGAGVFAQTSNTGTGWEKLTFNLATKTAGADLDVTKVYNKFSIFPNWTEVTTDTANRAKETADRVYLFDDFKFEGVNATLAACPATPVVTAPTNAPATPTATNTISIFSNAYTPTAGVNLGPNWGASTVQTTETIAGNSVWKLTNFNYQGIDFDANRIDVSSKTHLHVDFWSASASSVKVFIIDPAAEQPYIVTLTPNSWTSIDIPLSSYTSVTNKAAIRQIKLESTPSGSTVYVDNIYFK